MGDATAGSSEELSLLLYVQKMAARREYLAKPVPVSVVNGRRFTLVQFFQPEELWSSVSGEIVLARAESVHALLGLENAEMFLEHAGEIGTGWQGFCPVFPGTLIWYLIWRGRSAGWRIGTYEPHALLEQHFRLVVEV